jgi:hypothetical protein
MALLAKMRFQFVKEWALARNDALTRVPGGEVFGPINL